MAKDILKELDKIKQSDIHAKEWMRKDLANLKAHIKASSSSSVPVQPSGISALIITGVILIASLIALTIFMGDNDLADPNIVPDDSEQPTASVTPDNSKTPITKPTKTPIDRTETPTQTPDNKQIPGTKNND